jgi:hypothetical protein
MKSWSKCLLAGFVFVLLTFAAEGAFAADVSGCSTGRVPAFPVDSAGNVVDFFPSGLSPYDAGDPDGTTYMGLTGRIIDCIQDIFFLVGIESLGPIRDGLSDIVTTMMVLAIAFFSIKVALGGVQGEQATAETIMLIVKLAALSFFAFGLGLEWFYPIFSASQRAFMGVMVSVLQDAGPSGTWGCSVYAVQNKPWLLLDCAIAEAIGGAATTLPGSIPSMTATAGSLVIASDKMWVFASVIIGLLFTGAGPMLFLLFILIIIMVIAALASVTITYLLFALAFSILMLLGPAIVPLYLFQATKSIFDRWLQAVFAYSLMPMILVGYVVFMVKALEVVIIGPDANNPGSSPIGITQIWKAAASSAGVSDTHAPFIKGAHTVEGQAQMPATDGRAKSKEGESFSAMKPSFEFRRGAGDFCSGSAPPGGGSYQSCIVDMLLLNMFALLVMLALLTAFLNVILGMSSEIAGLESRRQLSLNVMASTAKVVKKAAIEGVKLAIRASTGAG